MAGEEEPGWPKGHPKIQDLKRQEAFPSPEDRQVGHLIGPVVEVARKIVAQTQEKMSLSNSVTNIAPAEENIKSENFGPNFANPTSTENNLSPEQIQIQNEVKENENQPRPKQLHFDVNGNKFEAVKPKEDPSV